MTFNSSSGLRCATIPLNFGTGAIPALGFGTLIPDPVETKSGIRDALRVGFRHFDCAERYRNEREVLAIARQTSQTPAQVLLAWAIQRGTAVLTTAKTLDGIRENYNISEIPEAAVDKINRIQTRTRLNKVVETGVPGFIPKADSVA
ncbi:MAG TPA: hypothetical protein VGO59_02640 [Verrucomicrobiae bacterium]|jgi:diketogulonate reductase-like aldo/keto reductase